MAQAVSKKVKRGGGKRSAHPCKAGPKRPPNMVSYRETYGRDKGKRHWKAA